MPSVSHERRKKPAPAGMQLLGLDTASEALYRSLLRAPGLTADSLAAATAQEMAAVQDRLVQMKARGLVRGEGSQGCAWFATAPEVAVELLLMERQVELNHARQILPALQRDLIRGAGHPDNDAVQIVAADAASQLPIYLQMHQTAQREIAAFLCPPFTVSAPDAMEAAREQARRRGVRYRTLVVPEMLSWPGWADAVRHAHAAGEQIRVLADLPFKMLLADRSAGLIPLRTDAPMGPSLRLGATAALDALWLLFESLWSQGVPALPSPAEEGHGEPAVATELHALVTLLAAGVNDKGIAGTLNISERTLLRRIQALSTQLQARSRFQCGWLAAKHFLGPD